MMSATRTGIILVHGFYSDASACHALSRVLATEYPVYPVDLGLTYDSLESCIDRLKDHVIKVLEQAKVSRLCFIGHSTGGVVIRGLMHNYPELAERTLAALMVAVPNRGTALADIHENLLPEVLRIHQPIAAITRTATAAANWYCPDHLLIMGFAGVKSWGSTRSLFTGINDGVVAASSVRLDQMEDLVLLPSDHLDIMSNFSLALSVLYFLKHLALPPQLYRMNRMDLAEKFRLIYERNAMDELVAQGRGNIELGTFGGKTFWTLLAEANGWKLQQNNFTKHIRLLNPSNTRKAWGSYHRIDEMMDTVIARLQSSSFIEQKNQSNDPVVQRLERLQSMFDKGLVSEAEFEMKRSQLLNEI